MKISINEKCDIGEYVFYKSKDEEWLPGIITNIKKNIYYISDFSTKNISKIFDKNNIINFEENLEWVFNNTKYKKNIDELKSVINNFYKGKNIPKEVKKIITKINEENNNDKGEDNINSKKNDFLNKKRNLINNKDSFEEEVNISSISEESEKNDNLTIKKYKNFDFYEIVKYLKRFAEYIDNNEKGGKKPYFNIEEQNNFISLMDYLNNIEMNDTIKFLRITNIGNYINYINKKTNIKEFKDLTQKFIDINSEKIQLQLFVENTLEINDIDSNGS